MDSLVNVVCGTLLLLAVLAGVFVLAWHGTLTSAEVYGTVTTIISIGGAAFAVSHGVNAGKKAAVEGAQATTTNGVNT